MSKGERRSLDLFLSCAGLLIILPIGLAIALLIYAEDRGPVFFKQKRAGRNKKPFWILKFRSMRDDRVTAVGKWLRATGLDELPQFINVLQGNMRIVGPRPLTDEDINRLEWLSERHAIRWSVPPGITGSAQLFGGGANGNSWYWDLDYIRHRSALLDLRIILLSCIANVFGKTMVKRWSRRRQGESKNDFTGINGSC